MQFAGTFDPALTTKSMSRYGDGITRFGGGFGRMYLGFGFSTISDDACELTSCTFLTFLTSFTSASDIYNLK